MPRDAMRNNVKGAPRFPYANRPLGRATRRIKATWRGKGCRGKGEAGRVRGGGARDEPAKITVGNNGIDWEDELARALREMDNISLGRPLQGTIR